MKTTIDAPTSDDFAALQAEVAADENKQAADEAAAATTAATLAADEAKSADAQARLAAVEARTTNLETALADGTAALGDLTSGVAVTVDSSDPAVLNIQVKMPPTADPSRRIFLGGLATMLSTTAIANAKPSGMNGGLGSTTTGQGSLLSINLAFSDGKSLTLLQTNATDVGDYVSTLGSGFVQHCYRIRASGNGDYRDAFTVYFRPDASGARYEIAVEYGCDFDFSASPPKPRAGVTPSHAPAYTATISGGTLAAPVTISVPGHVWTTRWRWYSAPRPLVRNAADIFAMRATMPLDKTLAFGATVPFAVSWKGPMSSAGLALGQGTPGDRPEIGLITEHQAAWLLGLSTAAMETSWRAQAEATGTMPFWVRDVATGSFVDPGVHKYVCFNDANHGPYAIPRSTTAATIPNFGLELSHQPAAAFLPWLLTDDPYFLEGAQAAALYGNLETNLYTFNQKLPHLVDYSEPRGFAWGMRDMFRVAAFTPTAVPLWLQPRSFWNGFLPDNLTFAQRYINATASPITTVFGLFYPWFSNFMQDYLNHAFAEEKYRGTSPSWDAVLSYVSRCRMGMSDNSVVTPGVDGWDCRIPSTYNVPMYNLRLGAAAPSGPGPAHSNWNMEFSVNTPANFAEAWVGFKAWASTGAAGIWTDPATAPPDQLIRYQYLYWPEIRSALAALSQAGIAGAKARHDWMAARMPANAGGAALKWSIPAV